MQEKVYQYLLIAALFLTTITFGVTDQKTYDLRGQLDSIQDQLNVLSWQYNEDKAWLEEQQLWLDDQIRWFEEEKKKLAGITHFIPADNIAVHGEVGR